MSQLLQKLRDRWQAWRERRDPARLVRRLYAEGVIDDEMLLHARAMHVVHGGRREDWPLPLSYSAELAAEIGSTETRNIDVTSLHGERRLPFRLEPYRPAKYPLPKDKP